MSWGVGVEKKPDLQPKNARSTVCFTFLQPTAALTSASLSWYNKQEREDVRPGRAKPAVIHK